MNTAVLPERALQALRDEAPLVQCIANTVVTNFTANVLLALGASPAMVDLPGEAAAFAAFAGGTLVNLGTPTAEQRDAARQAVIATDRWVLDPVAVGVLPVRTALAQELLEHRPAIVRGNPSEILAVAGLGAGGRGVDATDTPDAALDAAITLAKRTGGIVAVSGPVDVITDGEQVARVRGGSILLTKVTGGGCSLGAVMAGFLGVSNPLEAAVTASLVYAQASERAEARSSGPGSFAVAFIDELASLRPEDLDSTARVSWNQ